MAMRLQEKKQAEVERREAAMRAMENARRRQRNPEESVRLMFECARQKVPFPNWIWNHGWLRSIVYPLAGMNHRNSGAFERLVLHLMRVAPRMLTAPGPYDQDDYLGGLAVLAGTQRSWRRGLEEWRPSGRNPRRQFSELARWLLAEYRMPMFLDSVFFEPQAAWLVDWFVYLGGGGSPRHLPHFQGALTRRMGHCFLQAPEDLPAMRALRFGQAMGRGVEHRVARALAWSRLGSQLWPGEEEQWIDTLLLWFANQPMLATTQVVPLVDYLTGRRFGDGYTAADPSFRMAGRSVAATLELAREWQRELGRRDPVRQAILPPSGIPGGQFTTGDGVEYREWTIQELLTTHALADEGRAMRHCVATYAEEVLRGESAIFGMRVCWGGGSPSRAVTIEVNPRNRRIVQVRGKLNRDPTRLECSVLRQWAAEASLTDAWN